MKKIILLLVFVGSVFANTSINLPVQVRAGINTFSISDSQVDDYGLDIGIHYDIKRDDLLIDIGLGFNYARVVDNGTVSGYSYLVKEQLSTFEVYTKFTNGRMILKPAFIYGKMKESVSSTQLAGYEDEMDIMGLGLYVDLDYTSVFIKKLDIKNELSRQISIMGIQYIF